MYLVGSHPTHVQVCSSTNALNICPVFCQCININDFIWNINIGRLMKIIEFDPFQDYFP